VIQNVITRKGASAITSDHWHVVHSRFTAGDERPFVRVVHSEHADGAECRAAARELRSKLAAESPGVPEAERDEVFVRRPNFKSLRATRVRKRRTGASPKRKGK